MGLVRLDSIFDVHYGTDLELNKLEKDRSGIRFVSRNRNMNGIVAHVKRIDGLSPNPANSISVPLGSSSVLWAHFQDKEYYSGRDLAYLTPVDGVSLNENQMMYYCLVLRQNRIKYNYGRQANTSLSSLLVPDISDIPEYVNNITIQSLDSYQSALLNKDIVIDFPKFRKFKLYPYLFDMQPGTYIEKEKRKTGVVPLISSSDRNNGAVAMTNLIPTFKGNCITIGKVNCSSFYQSNPFCATADCTVLIPQKRLNMDIYSGLFIATILNKESVKWNYGRQIRLNDCQNLEIYLPATENGEPDITFMSEYIRSLRYSKFLK